MTEPSSCPEWASDSPMRMASWQQWMFNLLARWEEASLARSLGLPVERVIFVDLRHTARRSAGLRAPDVIRASDAS
jgi:hypothetical protein